MLNFLKNSFKRSKQHHYVGEIDLEVSYCNWDIKIPFNNMLELIKYFLHLAYTSDMEELTYFLIADDEKDLQKKIYSCLPLYQCLIQKTEWNSIFPEFSKFWMKFNKKELDNLLKDPFFDDYHASKNIPYDELKKDLNNLYSELLIIFTINDTIEKNQDIIDMVLDSLADIENSSLDVLAQKIQSLEKENAHLKVENYKLKEGYGLLKDQVKLLQYDSEQSDDAKVEAISRRINSLFPKSVETNADIAQFSSIFNSLKPSTQHDLKSAISLIDNFQGYDLALLQLTRSVEREFIVNFIVPFQESSFYYDIKDPYCNKKRYCITHKILMVGNKPTMGNIPFIGMAVLDSKAMKASNVIEAFSIFLEDNREPFAKICKDLGNYEIGIKNFKLVDIRNGIAHGDDNVTGDIDQDTYEQVNKMLFEPPMQILSNIIKYSMKKM